MDRVDDQDHNIKNAAEIREILENDGQVLAVFSGHDHQGGYINIKGYGRQASYTLDCILR
jgi:hypothetical protein